MFGVMPLKRPTFMMKVIKKWVLFLAGLLLLAFTALTLVAMFWLGPLAQKAVEKYGPEVLGAEVRVEDVSVGILRGVVKIKGLYVGNPQGFSQPSALEVGNFQLNMQLASLRTDTIVIDDVLIDEPLVTYERSKGEVNLKQLMANAQAYADKLSGGEQDKAADDEPAKKVLIKRLRIRNGQVRTKLPGLPPVTLKLPDVEKHNIGGASEGTNYGQAARDVLGSLSDGASDVVKGAGDKIRKAAEEALKVGKEVGKETGKKILDVGDDAIDNATDAVKGIGDLFKK